VFLPIGDSPNPRSVPWVNYALIAANVVVFVVLWPLTQERPSLHDPLLEQYVNAVARSPDEAYAVLQHVTRYDLFLFDHGFRPAAPSLVDLLTSMFLHGGLAHLAGNMLFLWIFGNNVEHRLGAGGYLLAYLGGGAAATAGDALLRLHSQVPSVGASGAISCVLGFYFLWFPQNRVHVWVFLFPFLMDVIELPARFVLAIFVLVDNLLPLIVSGAEGGVAYGAHLGGFLAGTVAAALLRHARPELEPGPWRPPEPTDLAATFRTAIEDGRLTDAAGLLLYQPRGRTRTLAADLVLRLGRALEEASEAQAALAVYLRLLGDHAAGPERIDARLGAARLLLTTQPALAYQHLAAALREGPDVAQDEEARRLLKQLAAWTRSIPRGRWRS
jgi:membrane associated rhomboid family serine protease